MWAKVDRFKAHPLFIGIRCRAEPFLADLHGSTHLADLAHLAAAGLALDLIGPATDTGTPVGRRGLFSAGHLAAVAELAVLQPTLRIVINHAAGVPIDGEQPAAEWLSAMQGLAPHGNVYLKQSGQMEAARTQPARAGESRS